MGAGSGSVWKSVNNGGTWTPVFEKQSTLSEGHPERAIELLEPLLADEPLLVQRNLLADAWMAAGRRADAIRALEPAATQPREMRRPGVLTGMHHWLEQQDRLARLYREVGRLSEAEAIDRRLRVLLQFAHNDHPIKRRLDAPGASGS